MHIEKRENGDLLVLAASGILDNDSSIHFRNEIESCKRQGWHRIVVDLAGVTYMSSAGIAALLAAKEQLQQLNGLFGIYNPVPQVESVLKQVRLLDTLLCDPQAAKSARSAGSLTMALSTSTRFARGDGIDMEIYSLRDPQPLSWRMIGEPRALFESSSHDLTPFEFDSDDFGIGLGTLQQTPEEGQLRIGEIIAVAGTAAQSPQIHGGLPDYSVSSADFTPAARLLYWIQWSGDFTTLIRFEPSERGKEIGFSALIRQALQETEMSAAAFVILGDCAGLVGAQLRRVPESAAVAGSQPFDVPRIRDWLSFSAEQVYRNNLALIAGVAMQSGSSSASALGPFVRQLDPQHDVHGHFHAAVFPYRTLKKRTLRLERQVAELFDSGALQDVLHLLRDDRPITGSGESELLSGACWIGPLDDAARVEEAG